jgi:23S rRNA pseudouridine2457 synthase
LEHNEISRVTMLIALNKPFDVQCKFTDAHGRRTLADYVDVPGIYPAGRLDHDSEGLVLLTDDGRLQHRLSDPRFKKEKGYWVQVERLPSEAALQRLRAGVEIKSGRTKPATVWLVDEPDCLWPRMPPVRFRKTVPTAWLDLRISEGKNRQVRRMTAAVGHPTLRLIRYSVGAYTLDGLAPGESRTLDGRR